MNATASRTRVTASQRLTGTLPILNFQEPACYLARWQAKGDIYHNGRSTRPSLYFTRHEGTEYVVLGPGVLDLLPGGWEAATKPLLAQAWSAYTWVRPEATKSYLVERKPVLPLDVLKARVSLLAARREGQFNLLLMEALNAVPGRCDEVEARLAGKASQAPQDGPPAPRSNVQELAVQAAAWAPREGLEEPSSDDRMGTEDIVGAEERLGILLRHLRREVIRVADLPTLGERDRALAVLADEIQAGMGPEGEAGEDGSVDGE